MSTAAPSSYRFGLTGFPLGHSRSPHIHAAALHAAGLAGSYDLYPVEPGDPGQAGLRRLVAALRRGELHGLNVTIPHKQAIFALVDRLTPAAQAIGAANLLYVQAGQVVGDNSDAPGFLADLKGLWRGWDAGKPRQALVLGAGGAARAVVYALLTDGWGVQVAARRTAQAQELCAHLGKAGAGAQALSLEHLPALDGRDLDMLVNTTPLGMAPGVDACPWPENLDLPPRAAVYDLVYNPFKTRLVQRALNAGLAATGGLGMLVEQAALSFERWTALPAPRPAMWAAAEGSLAPHLQAQTDDHGED
ncbi:MAG: shikimate dehydrogenase [Chloroflexi bacterium]|nr:shikimate dehydrogenase [Chloroflexota bacterium]